MPTNLPPEYFQAEERYKAAETHGERVILLEELIGTIPKHKGTDKLRADLRRRLSKLKEAAQSSKGGARQASPYQIEREGAGQVAVIGPPNSGKSSLIATLTNANPLVAEYPFSTQRPTPGMMPIDNIQAQLIDTPPLHPDFDEPQLYHLIRNADMILLVIDMQEATIQQYEDSLALLEEHRIIPLQMKDRYTNDPRRLTFKPLRVLVNKTDNEALDEDFAALCELLGEDTCPLIPISILNARYIDRMKSAVYDALGIVRIYSKPPGHEPDFSAPFVMKRGGTVEQFAAKVHKDLAQNLKSARVWGAGVFDGQQVGRDYVLNEGDVVELRG
jgi:hypothetical protein